MRISLCSPTERELWDALVQLKDCDDLSSRVALIITDLENAGNGWASPDQAH